MMKLISHKIFLKHDMEGHPERADRIKRALKTFPYENAVDGEKHLSKVHTARYITKVKEASARAGDGIRFLDAGETYACKDTYKAACYAVGAAVQAAEYALKKQNAFALVRPPGHHAHPDWTNGFCVFNSISVAAKYLVEKKEKVLIIDIDMHRGDGTSEVVQKDGSGRMYYFSINQYGVFPGMAIDEGNIKNIYVEPTITEDEYIEILKKEIPALINKFKPTVVAISAGFDCMSTDRETHAHSLGCGLSLTKKTILALKRLLNGTPYFAVLEGGYNPESIVEGVGAFLGVAVKEEKEAAKKTKNKTPVKKSQKGPIKNKPSAKTRRKSSPAKKSAGKKKTKAKKAKRVVKKKANKAVKSKAKKK